MSEQTQRRKIIVILKDLHGVAVENPAGPGTPDVNYIDGWIELKWIRRWPKVPAERPILIHHYTPQQRLWIRRRGRLGGKSFLLLQVGREWLLFKHEEAYFVGKISRDELYKTAYKVWFNGLNKEEFMTCLK